MSLTGKQSITREAAHALKPENPPIATISDLEKGSTTDWHPPQRRMSVTERASTFISEAGVIVNDLGRDVWGMMGMASVKENKNDNELPRHK